MNREYLKKLEAKIQGQERRIQDSNDKTSQLIQELEQARAVTERTLKQNEELIGLLNRGVETQAEAKKVDSSTPHDPQLEELINLMKSMKD